MKGKSATAKSAPKKTVESESESEQESDLGSYFGSEAEALQDGEDTGEVLSVLSPFGPETFQSAELCWAHAESVVGFSLKALRVKLKEEGMEWSDYHRIRLVNYLRKLGPEKACLEAPTLRDLSADSPIWEREDLLMPVLPDDLLLFDAESESDSGSERALPADKGGKGNKGNKGNEGLKGLTGTSTAACEAEEVHRLRAELQSLKRLLSASDDNAVHATKSPELPWQTTRSLRAAAVSLQTWLSAHRELVAGRTILNLGCGANVLGLVCARLGAQVVAVDASVENLTLARTLAEANMQIPRIQLLRGDLEESPGFGLADGVLCERLIMQPSLAKLLQLLAARQRHLQEMSPVSSNMSWVFPRYASLHLSGCDFSKDLEEKEALADVAGLNLSRLAPRAAQAGSVAVVPAMQIRESLASTESVALFRADLMEHAESIFARREFKLELQPDRSLTSLMVELRLEEAGEDSHGSRPQTVLHLAEPDESLLCLCGRDFSSVEGYISGAPLEDGSLQLAVALTASARRSDGNAGRCLSAEFTIPGGE